MNYKEKLKERFEIKKMCESDLEYRKEVLIKCAEDSVFWCNNFAYTFDPREGNRNLPFILWDKQVEYVRWVERLLKNHEDGLIEKSRDVGVSYTTLTAVVLYQCCFMISML